MRATAKDIDAYIAGFPKPVQNILQEIRVTIQKAAPQAEEAIRYSMPTFRLHEKNLVFFGAFKDHVSFFPTAAGIAAFKTELSKYDCSKGTIRFPLKSKIPLPLIRKIVRYRASEIMTKVPPRPKSRRK